MKTEYIINGHSENTDDTFKVPYDTTVVFYANDDHKCIITDSIVGFNFAVDHMRINSSSSNIFLPRSTCKNYMIEGFDENNMLYIYKIHNEENNKQYETMFRGQLENKEFTLETICSAIRNITDGDILLYCTFCRGTLEADDKGIFEHDTEAFKIGDWSPDDSMDIENNDESFFENMSWSSGGKRQKNKKKQRIKTKRTIKTKRRIKTKQRIKTKRTIKTKRRIKTKQRIKTKRTKKE